MKQLVFVDSWTPLRFLLALGEKSKNKRRRKVSAAGNLLDHAAAKLANDVDLVRALIENGSMRRLQFMHQALAMIEVVEVAGIEHHEIADLAGANNAMHFTNRSIETVCVTGQHFTPALSHAALMASQSSIESARGFSHTTGQPCRAAIYPCSR